MQEHAEQHRHGADAKTKAAGTRPHERWLLASTVAATVSLIAAIGPGFASTTVDDHLIQRWVQPLPLPEPMAETEAGAHGEDAATQGTQVAEWRTVEVKPGQTMGAVFASLSLPSSLLHRLLERPGLREPLTRVRAGARFDFLIESDGSLRGLRFERDEARIATVTIDGDAIHEEIAQRDIQHRVNMASGVIEGSLVAAAGKSGIGYGTVLEMAKVFGYDIDFTQDLRVGDTFNVVYEEVYRDGERLRSGDILAASFINQGKPYHAFRYTFADGRTEYFDLEGRPMKKSFLRIPVEFTRISSQFTTARRHPVLGTMRAHKGVDYAARTGTPIMAAGEGRISFAGWQNGYGRTVIVDHGRGYTTLYGHMSRLGGYAKGARVRQGDTIGYVGASGLATGPHLHYEFRINGAHRDPLKVTLPKPEPLPASELGRFQEQTRPLLARLDLLGGKRHYAAR
ncbi:MAG: peptidoglycan DD-metalloendopeptidase family protein [Xanthomonadaceae bacterium]|nr:peptidoglycan DD-metalloendopeptidase family protein [Xanthomonadaceae bacterium]